MEWQSPLWEAIRAQSSSVATGSDQDVFFVSFLSALSASE
jgi:hypothetical protein